MFPSYAELHCLTNFTFLRGASHPEELVERAAKLGYSALAITDECSLAGVVRAHLAAREVGLKLVVGAEFTLLVSPSPFQGEGRGGSAVQASTPIPTFPLKGGRSDSTAIPTFSLQGGSGVRLVLLATDRDGYGHLSELITLARRRSKKGEYDLRPEDLDNGAPGCLALLLPGEDPDPAQAHWLAERCPGRCWIAAELLLGQHDDARLAALEALSLDTGVPLVATGDVHMHVRARRALQDVLTAVRLRRPVAACGRALHPNGERHLRSRERLARLYPPELLIETISVAERCRFSLDELRYEYPEEIVPPGETPASWLRKLAEQGFEWRFGAPLTPSPISPSPFQEEGHPISPSPFQGEGRGGGAMPATSKLTPIPAFPLEGGRSDSTPIPAFPLEGGKSGLGWGGHFTAGRAVDIGKARALVEHELRLIAELRYEPYFLTVYDIVKFARAQGILCQGRGSAANSAVCYCLGVTEVDPARMEMLFERFISKERNEPPDIDIDFEHERREEVIQYVYAKYGRSRAALAATVICYRTRSAVRDIGKALGLDLAQVDRLAKNLAWWDVRRVLPQRLREAGFDPDSRVIRDLVDMVNIVVGFPRHLSQHVGGFVISRGPLSRMVPIENAAMPERSIIQWDKDDLDALGLLKVDVLGLGMLTAIRRALQLMSGYRGRPFGMSDVPPEDPGVYEMVGRADTIGVFQIESRAQQAMLPRMRPKCFYDLVIEVAIVRPGPIQGGMIHPYLRRRQGLEPVTYPSEAVRGVLERTLGVPIFQEQVMQLAIVAAGFTPGEADKLRRAMAAWRRRGGLEPFEQRLKDGMHSRGYSEAFAQQIYQQILGFGEYGFPESHSASFALLVYVSCWLKRYEPAAFTCALLNSQPMGFYAPAQLLQDAQRHGVEVRPVDVLYSEWDCTLESAEGGDSAGPAIRLGLRMVKGMSEEAAKRLVEARPSPVEGEGAIFEDLAHAARLNRHDMNALAAAGALASIEGHRRQAAWAVTGIHPRAPLLGDAPILECTPALVPPREGDELVADYASLGFTLGRHPVALLRQRLTRMRMVSAAQLREIPHGRLARAAGLVIGRQRPDTASGVIFVTLEDETGMVNVVVWNDLAQRQRRELLGSRLLAVHGVVERQGEVVHLIAGRLFDHSHLLGRLSTRSRDFH